MSLTGITPKQAQAYSDYLRRQLKGVGSSSVSPCAKSNLMDISDLGDALFGSTTTVVVVEKKWVIDTYRLDELSETERQMAFLYIEVLLRPGAGTDFAFKFARQSLHSLGLFTEQDAYERKRKLTALENVSKG